MPKITNMLKNSIYPKILLYTFCVFIFSSNVCLASVKINEFLAANDSANQDPQGDYDDWIELYNSGTETIDLTGYYLTDDLGDLTQWSFPQGTTIDGGDYLLIWADKDTSDNPSGIHSNFKLSAGGESIGLIESDGTTIVDSITFSEQSDDISYGRYPDGSDNWYPMNSPSAEAENSAAMSEKIYFSKLGDTISESFVLKLSTPSNTGIIRYTLNGDTPNLFSAVYNDDTGIFVGNQSSTIIRARSYQTNFAPGPVRTECYIAMSSELKSFESNLPIIIIETLNNAIPLPSVAEGNQVIHADPIFTYASFFDTDETSGLSKTNNLSDYSGRSGLNIRGQSTSFLPKRPYKLETWDEYNEDIDVPLLGFPADSDWILSNPYTDRSFMRTMLAMELSNEMGYYSPRTRFVELFVNEDGGQVGGPNSDDYKGVYVLMEKIKRGEKRVNIDKLSPSDNTEPDITGGYIIRHDKNRPQESFSTWAGRWYYVEPSDTEITAEQKNYIQNYLYAFEQILLGPNFSDPDIGYSQYIDVDSFIVNDFCSEITKEVDTYLYSTFVTKERNGKLKMSPQWDFNISMGNNDYRIWDVYTHHTDGWHRDSNNWMDEYNWHKRLMEDPEYLRRYADKWFHLRETVLSDESIESSLDRKSALVNQGAAARNFSRWDILNSYAGFDWAYPGSNFYYGGNPELPNNESTHTYSMQVEWLKNWLTGNGTPANPQDAENFAPQYSDRLGWIDANMQSRTNFAPPPTIYLNGNQADIGGSFEGQATISFSGNEIYYTLDGTDPREAFTGNAIGTLYTNTGSTSQILVNENSPCMLKIPTNSNDEIGWKSIGFDESSWIDGFIGVGYETSGNDYAQLINLDISSMKGLNQSLYIRIPFNVTDKTLISELELNMKYDDAFVAYINGIEVARSAHAPDPVFWNSGATSYHPDNIAINFENFIANSGITSLQNGNNILAIHLLNSGLESSDILCVPQLVATLENLDNGITIEDSIDLRIRSKSGLNWSALNQAVFSNSQVKNNLRITEIMYNPSISDGEFIELKNIGNEAINLYLCKFTNGIEFTFPNRTLNPGEFILVVQDQAEFTDSYSSNGNSFNIAGEFEGGTKLSNGGERITLEDASGQLIHDFSYEDNYPITDGTGFSICVNNPESSNLLDWDTTTNWYPSNSLGGNPGIEHIPSNINYGSIIINEVLAHQDTETGDWIELHNTTDTPIDIGGWFFSDDETQLKKYQIASGTTVPADGFVVFTQTNHFGDGANDLGNLEGFGLSEYGETIYLSSGSLGELSGGYSISQAFGASLNGVSIGRPQIDDTANEITDFIQLDIPTLGAKNSQPIIPDVVINEIHYKAVNQNDALYEYIELFNRSSETIYLYDENNPSNTWKFEGGIEYIFPEGVSIPSGGHLLITRTDPEIFRYLNSLPDNRLIYGPYTNSLDNDKDTIQLMVPGIPDPGLTPYILSERISYSDGSDSNGLDLWPNEPDSLETYSLQRESVTSYANNPLNWKGLSYSPNSENIQNLEIIFNGQSIEIHWIGDRILQSTDNLSNPWTDVTNMTSPHTIDTETSPSQFFRFNE